MTGSIFHKNSIGWQRNFLPGVVKESSEGKLKSYIPRMSSKISVMGLPVSLEFLRGVPEKFGKVNDLIAF